MITMPPPFGLREHHDNELLRREFQHAGAMARHAARRVLDVDPVVLHAELDALIDEHVALWPRRNREGGAADSVAKLRASRAYIQDR